MDNNYVTEVVQKKRIVAISRYGIITLFGGDGMNNLRFEQQIRFLIEIDKLKSVYRQNYLVDGSRKENDTEHSWHLAMMVVVLAEYFSDLNVLKALNMVLIHDLVEIDAGDTFAYDDQANISKNTREKIAARRIFSLLPTDQAAEMFGLWEEFERMETPEALCAAIVDRIQPLTINMCSEGKMWLEHGVLAAKVRERNKIVFENGPQLLSQYVQRIIEDATAKKYLSSVPTSQSEP